MKKTRRAFTLVEVLTVIGIVVILAAASLPALQSLKGASSTNRAIGNLSSILELARTYARANHTYVRVGFYALNPAGAFSTAAVVIVPVYSVDGSQTAAMIADNWRALARPLFLNNFVFAGSLNATSPDTSADSDPFSSASSFGTLTLPIAGTLSVPFGYFVEFTPSGEACLEENLPVRYIKIGIASASGNASNPFILRLSGINGTMTVLRAEDMK